MFTKSYIYLIPFLISTAMFLLTGCSGGGASTANGQGSISAKLVWNDSKTTAKSVASAPVGVATVRISISGAGMTTIQQDFPAADGSGTLIGVPAGNGLTVTATGLDASGAITHQGAVGNVTVQNGLTTDVGSITMQLFNRLTAAIGTYNGLLYYADGTIDDTFSFVVDADGNITGNNAATFNDTTFTGTLTALSATQFSMTATVLPGNYAMQGTLNSTSGSFTGGTITGGINANWIASKAITSVPSPSDFTSAVGSYVIASPDQGIITIDSSGNAVITSSGTVIGYGRLFATQTGTSFTFLAAFTTDTDTLQGTLNPTTGSFSGTLNGSGAWTASRQAASYSNISLNGPWMLVLADGTGHDYFTFNGNGVLSNSSTYNALPGTYNVQADGTYALYLPTMSDATVLASGKLSSSSVASINWNAGPGQPGGIGSLLKVSNVSACQGAWEGSLVETIGGATYDVTFVVDANGAITSFSGFSGPVTGNMYSEGGKLVAFFTTARSDAYSQFAFWGSLSGETAAATYDNDSSSDDIGTVQLKRIFNPSAVIGKTIYWADQGGYGYFRFTSDGKFYGTGNINNGASAENGPGTYSVEDRGFVSYQVPSFGSGSATFLSNNFDESYWRVQTSTGPERWFYGSNAAAEAQAFYLSGVAP